MNYSETTVLLDSDLSLNWKSFEAIGNRLLWLALRRFWWARTCNQRSRSGIFIGYNRLFGYSEGLTIKNFILDSSCSITSLYRSSNNAYVGVAGYCLANDAPCVIENSVNMASISFIGNLSDSYSLYLGGYCRTPWVLHTLLCCKELCQLRKCHTLWNKYKFTHWRYF